MYVAPSSYWTRPRPRVLGALGDTPLNAVQLAALRNKGVFGVSSVEAAAGRGYVQGVDYPNPDGSYRRYTLPEIAMEPVRGAESVVTATGEAAAAGARAAGGFLESLGTIGKWLVIGLVAVAGLQVINVVRGR